MTRSWHSRTLFQIALLGLCAALTACGATPAKNVAGPRGTLRFQCNEPDAQLEVDENHVGPIGMFSAHGILVRPGPHRIVVRKSGFFDAYALVDVTVNTVQSIEIALRPIPD